ncbi:MAG TPA: response regulator [Candidatus Desulfaltia sp.]|nr:response regulator [Candidatus Desulfaltia sp.]
MSSILLVDDDEDILLLTKLMLEDAGYRVETANTGHKALEKAKESQHNVVFIDYRLPDIKGNELAEKLNHIDESAVIFYLTGCNLGDEDRGTGTVRDTLLKPVNNEAILSAVRGALSPPLAGNGRGKEL